MGCGGGAPRVGRVVSLREKKKGPPGLHGMILGGVRARYMAAEKRKEPAGMIDVTGLSVA